MTCSGRSTRSWIRFANLLSQLPILQVVKSPLGRRIWRLAKTFNRPVTEIAEMIPEEMDFYDFSMLADDPKKLEQYENSYYDPEYEAFERAFDEEMRQKREEREEQEILMREQERGELLQSGYDVPAEEIDGEQWERVE